MKKRIVKKVGTYKLTLSDEASLNFDLYEGGRISWPPGFSKLPSNLDGLITFIQNSDSELEYDYTLQTGLGGLFGFKVHLAATLIDKDFILEELLALNESIN